MTDKPKFPFHDSCRIHGISFMFSVQDTAHRRLYYLKFIVVNTVRWAASSVPPEGYITSIMHFITYKYLLDWHAF